MKINTLIVGLGKIGMLYDFTKKKHFNNHCEAILTHKDYNLIGAVETNPIKKRLFKKKYNLPVFLDLNKAYKNLNPEMIIISTPTEKNKKLFNLIKKRKIFPKIFLIEKPGSYDFNELKKFLILCKKNKIKVFINYTRSYSNFIHKLKKILSFKNIGNIYKVEILYHKGIYNSCSHYINLLLNIFNTNVYKILGISKKRKFNKDFLINFKLLIKYKIYFKFTKNNTKEKIIFYGNKKNLVYLTEYSKTFYNNGVKKMINNDFHKNLRNILNNIKESNRKKIEINIIKSLNTLKIISQITSRSEKNYY